ncbi:MAG: helix-turn-helix domain-containing protein [Rubrivivax sp.]|nr:helix-turn-helix domain-containing protein [Rubrivivax sp.]
MTEPSERRPACSTREAADALGISVPSVQRWVDAGLLKAWRTAGGHRRIDRASIEALLRRRGDAAPEQVVVVVDDSADDRDLLGELVRSVWPAAELHSFDNGFDGLVAIGRLRPSLVVTDLSMPGMDGIEMLRRLADSPQTAQRRMVAVSSLSPAQVARRGGLPAGVPLLAKPVEADAFAAAVHAMAAEPPR